MRKTVFLIILIIIRFLPCNSQAGILDPPGIAALKTEAGELFTIHSEILGMDKEIMVGLPCNFSDSGSYPLILVLEAEVLFESTAPLTRLMADVEEIPECIVAGIPFHNKHLEYAPRLEGIPESGNADRMLEFFEKELFPLLDSRYHGNGQKILWAHSGLGGIFCTYVLLGTDSQFSGIISSSPNLKRMQEYITKENAFEKLAQKDSLFYYLSFGGNEAKPYMNNMLPFVEEFRNKLEVEAPENLVWKYQLNDNNNHFTNAIESFMEGLILYFKTMEK